MATQGVRLDLNFAFNNTRFSDKLLHIINKSGTRESIYIDSTVLAAQYSFFLKMFLNDMKESKEQEVLIHVDDEQEMKCVGLLIKFMYTGVLEATSGNEIFLVRSTADKFGVPSCVFHCEHLISLLPMDLELAVLCINYLSAFCPLKERAEAFLDTSFSTNAQILPLCAMEAALGSNKLCVSTEDEVYDIVMQWIEKENKEDQQGLMDRLTPLIRFPMMSTGKLKQIINGRKDQYFDRLVLNALFFKLGVFGVLNDSRPGSFTRRKYTSTPKFGCP